MKVYFAASIYGGRELLPIYKKIQKIIENLGHEFLTKHVTSQGIMPEEKLGVSPQSSYLRDMKLLDQADIFMAEVSQPSLGTGFEIAQAISRRLPVLCLHKKGIERSISALVRGCTAENYQVKAYREDNLEKIIKEFLKEQNEKRKTYCH